MLDLLIAQLKIDEGLRLEAYQDSVGVWTIGYGHTPSKESQTITRDQAEAMLKADATKAVASMTKAWPWVADLDEPRQAALANMVFNLGLSGVSEFKKMLNGLRYKDWGTAAGEALRSKWAYQVGARASRIARTFRTGV